MFASWPKSNRLMVKGGELVYLHAKIATFFTLHWTSINRGGFAHLREKQAARLSSRVREA